MKTLIANGTLVTPDATLCADLLLHDGRIAAIGRDVPREGAEVVEAQGLLVLPGGVDVHTHITLDIDAVRGTDAYYHGTVPAAAGGTTSIIDHMAFMPAARLLEEQTTLYRQLAKGRAAVDYSFHAVMQGLPLRDEDLAALPRLAGLEDGQGAGQGIASVKAYTTYDHRLDDAQLLQLLRLTKKYGLLTLVHSEQHEEIAALRAALTAEDKTRPINHARTRPAACEAKAVERVLALAAEAGDAPVYIVHLSTAAGLEAVQKARAAGQQHIFAETCTQYLTLTEECYLGDRGLAHIMAPPLRGPEDVHALWAGLRDGDIQTVATDHCFFTLADKERGRGDFTRCPGGAPGLEERLSVLYSEGVAKGRISLERFVQVTAGTPAAIFGLHPRKGQLAPGADADVVLLDPTQRHTLSARDLHGPSDYSLYEGLELRGRIQSVYLRGKRVFHQGRYTGRCGDGNFLPRANSL